jgi:hypothetical protein
MSDAHRRHTDHRPELHGQARSSRVVEAGGVHNDDVRAPGESSDGFFEERSLAKRQQSRHVAHGHDARHDTLGVDVGGLTRVSETAS